MFRKTLSVLLAVLLLCAAVPMGAVQAAAAEGSLSAEGDYPKLTPGTPFEVNITAGGEKAILAFTAAETGTYTFASSGDGDTIGVLYDSDMNEIASDDDSGEGNNFKITTALSAGGTFYLEAYYYSESKTGSFDVTAALLPDAQSVYVKNGSEIKGYPTENVQLEAGFLPEDCAEEYVTWASSDNSVAEIDDYGFLTFMGFGTATITVTSAKGLTATCKAAAPQPETIAVNETNTAVIDENGGAALFKFVAPETRAYRFCSTGDWYTVGVLFDSDFSQLEYEWGEDGGNFNFTHKLTKSETYYILARMDSYNDTGSFSVTVDAVPAATSVSIRQAPQIDGYIGYRPYLDVDFLPEGSQSESVTWSSDNASLVSVGSDGRLEMISAGSTKIHAVSENGLTAECTVTVHDDIKLSEGVAANGKIYEPYAWSRFAFTPSVSGKYIFCSENSSETTHADLLDSDLDRLAYGQGTYGNPDFTIKYDLEAGKTYYIKAGLSYSETGDLFVKVTKAKEATGVKIEADGAVYGYPDKYLQVKADFLPEGAAEENCSWETADSSVAEVYYSYGQTCELHFNKAGSTTLTVTTDSGLTDTVNVVVEDYVTLAAGETKTTGRYFDGDAYFIFTPEEKGYYSFYSSGEHTTVCALRDEYGYRIAGDDNFSGEGENFRFNVILEGGKTYYLETRSEDVQQAQFSVSCERSIAPESIEIVQGSAVSGNPQEIMNLSVRFLPSGAVEEPVYWSTSDDEICNVYSGKVYLNKPGKATITATSESGLTAECEVTVKDYDYETLSAGETKTATIDEDNRNFTFKVVPSETAAYSFSSSGELDTMATLYDEAGERLAYDDDGGENENFKLQYSLEAGKTYYLVTSVWGQETGEFSVTCSKVPYASAVSLNHSKVKGYAGEAGYLIVSPEPEDSYTGEIGVSSSDEDVVGVSAGNDYVELRYLSTGSAVVTVTTSTGLSASCTVTVVEPEELVLDETKSGSITYPNEMVMYRFVPATTDYYLFSSNADSYFVGNLYDSNMDRISNMSSSAGRIAIKKELEAGKVYYLSVGFAVDDETGSFEVKVEQTSVPTGLGIMTPPQETTYYEGYVTEGLNLHGLSVMITWSDGQETVWDYGTDRSPLRGESFRYNVSDEGKLTVKVGDASDSLDLTILENPVDRIEIDQNDIPELIEQNNGFWDSYYLGNTEKIEYFHYDLFEFDGVPVTIYYKDGTSVSARIGEAINDYGISVSSRQYRGEIFTVGGNNEVSINYLGVSTTVKVNVVEAPVASIEIISAPDTELIENHSGYWTTAYNPVTSAFDLKFFYYTLDNNSSARVRINYKDGTSKTADVGSYIDNERINISDNQYQEPWTVGGSYSFTISFLGASVGLPVTIVPSPVDYIEVPDGAALTLYENIDGYTFTYYNEDGDEVEAFSYYVNGIENIPVTVHFKDGSVKRSYVGGMLNNEYVQYSEDQYKNPWKKGGNNFITVTYLGKSTTVPVNIVDSPVVSIEVISNPTREYILGDHYFGGEYGFIPSDLTGFAFKVNYSDGTSKSFTSDDFEEGYRVDGHFFEIVTVNEKQTVGDNPCKITYMGKSADFSVKVVESNIKSIEMTRLPNIRTSSQYFRPNWIGAQVTVTYKNNTKKVVNLTRDNLKYRMNYLYPFAASFEIDGKTAVISDLYEEKEDGEFGVVYVLKYVNAEYKIKDVSYAMQSAAENVEIEDYSATGQNMLVKVTYADGTSESIRLTDIFRYEFSYSPEVELYVAYTEKGILNYSMINAEDSEADVYIFGKYIDVDGAEETFLRGDVNGDGEVTVEDATQIQRYLAEYSVSGVSRILKCGDTNCDGKVNIRDVSELQRFLAGYDNTFGIGEAI